MEIGRRMSEWVDPEVEMEGVRLVGSEGEGDSCSSSCRH